MKKALVYLIVIMLVFGFGCSSSKEEDYQEAMIMESMEPEAKTSDGFGNDDVKYGGIQTNRKIIQSAYIVMETLSFDETIKTVKDKTYEYLGYFEKMRVDGKRMDLPDNEQRRDAYFIIRIPKDKYEHFLNAFENMGNVIVNELNSEDVTDVYIDTEARLKTLKVQEERLLDILKTATEVEDIIVLEERLSEIRYDIEGYTGTIRKWDNLVDFTTVQLEISEVQKVTEPKPEGMMSRSVETFVESTEDVAEILTNFVIFAFGFTPYLIILVPLGFGVNFIAKRRKPKSPRLPKIKKDKTDKNKEKS